MDSQTVFAPNHPQVIHEVIEGEAILVNLDSGSYFSLDKVGAVVWELLEQGFPMGRLIDLVATQYAGTKNEIEEGVSQLVTELQREGLVVANGSTGPAVAQGTPSVTAVTDDRPAFEAPTLHKYTDMEDLIMLDPIHDVDESGWPHAKPEPQ